MCGCVFVCESSPDLDSLAQSTVTGLPTMSAEVTEIPEVGPVLPPHTAPSQVFGKEVGFIMSEWSECVAFNNSHFHFKHASIF